MNDKSAQLRVGVIGLGKMGGALADALLAQKFEVTVWNRTPAKAEPSVKAGANLARSVADAARHSNVVVVCLTDYAAVKAALINDDVGLNLRNKTVVDFTSMRTEELRELVAWANANGISLLKGTIPAYPDDIRAGKCSILYGGPRRVFDAIAPVLQAMGGAPAHIGDNPGDGVEMGRAYYCFLFPALVAFLHGAAVCHRAGLPIETYARGLVLPALKGPVLPGMLEQLTRATLTRRYDEGVQATLNIWRDALANVIHSVTSYRLDPGLLSAAKALLDRAAAQGFGEQDLAAVFEALTSEDR